jgi:predicted nuclease of restriction endonuclease-like (RecB) superfamily
MLAFARAWPDESILQQAAAQLPWFHNCVLLDSVKAPAEREFYVRQTLEHGWSRNVLVHQIESQLYRRQGKAITNFERLLPPPQSDLARDTLKDPYCFDFLGLRSDVEERELHRGLVRHIRDFLIELGSGFAYVGSQHHLDVGGEDFYIDLLFYHLRLRAFVAID